MKVTTAILLIAVCWVTLGGAEETIKYNRDIRPILSDRCFFCHGPDEHERKGDLRLDIREAAIENGSLVPGDVENSDIVYRLFTDDDDDLMPPRKSHKTMSAKEKELIVEWIKQGAEYEASWSLVAPAKSEISSKAKPIDHFIDKHLARAGLGFSKEADPRTLIRRVSFDLCGVPPHPSEVGNFLKDVESLGIDKAYSSLVDRLLASPAYGERMTMSWLDVARYGDSSVMHADGPRQMWPWRDWVINAYNTNKPFDEFTIEQLAGDLLPNATIDQKVASGFNRNHATSDEGGAFAEELRVEYIVDRVRTTSNVWMGLTMECAQCHDHKYDAISQKEYYEFFAFFNNNQDPGMQSRKGNQSPVVKVVGKEQQKELDVLAKKVAEEKANLAKYKTSNQSKCDAWVEAKVKALAESGDALDTNQRGLKYKFGIDSENKKVKEESGAIVSLSTGVFQTDKRDGQQALKLDGKTAYACDTAPNFKAGEPFSFGVWVKPMNDSGGAIFAQMDVDNKFSGYDLWMQARQIGIHIISSWSNDAVKVVSAEKLKAGVWHHVVVTYDGSKKAAGVEIYINNKKAKKKIEADRLIGSIETKVPFKIGSRSKGNYWKGAVDDIRIYNRVLSKSEIANLHSNAIQKILLTEPSKRTKKQTDTLREHYFATQDEQFRKISESHQKLVKQQTKLNNGLVTSMMMADNPPNRKRKTYILDRGAYDAPLKDQEVFPNVPAMLPKLPETEQKNRLVLAQWLTSKEHPLTARVTINRYWMMLFGEGLVRTAGDFGAQGVPPIHPELLDYLAVDFVESGWDVKRMIKQIVMSRTYRQSSKRLPNQIKGDPENLLLSRSPRFRLSGEMIRDNALLVSGLLVEKVGGKSVKPYQPVNIWNEVSLSKGLRYSQDKGENLYRKSIYTYWKRSAPMPNLSILNVPSRETCVIQRPRTNTPLQALVTLNDPQFVEAARHFAQRLLLMEKDDAKRIDLAFEICLARPASEKEQQIISSTLIKFKRHFLDRPESAESLIKVGDSPVDNQFDGKKLAAWTVIAQMILNLDETLTRN